MNNVSQFLGGTYVIAVSGGIDSVVLLDMLAGENSKFHPPAGGPYSTFVVAHFDHGMRTESNDDGQFVAGLAKKYGLAYETERQELGANASEALARQARYAFLRRVRDKYNAKQIMTAHHEDDVIETMIINIIRGTGWRGLCSLRNTAEIRRPLLGMSKAEIIEYAREHDLQWREDSTNRDDRYLRNAVRHHVMPRADRQVWLGLYESQKKLAVAIDNELALLSSDRRYDYIMWPQSVALEMMKHATGVTRAQADAALVATKTARSGSSITIGNKKKLTFTRDTFFVAPFKT